MNNEEGRAYLNYLLTLSIRREEAFGPMALTFLKEQDLDALQLIPDEQFSLIMAVVMAIAPEPKRYGIKLELLQRAQTLLSSTRYSNPQLVRQLDHDIKKTEAELQIYNAAMKPSRRADQEGNRFVVQTDVPDYFLNIAQKRASEYYQKKFGLTKESKAAQSFSGGPRKFEPENATVHREMPGACAPFMNSRINAFHLMMPFDLKISKKPDEPLDGGMRAFYTKFGYSYPLAYEMDRFCGYNDGEVLDIEMGDPHLLFVSFSRVKEREFQFETPPDKKSIPFEYVYPAIVLERLGTLGTYVQMVSNFKIWFDASKTNILITGAPDLYEYGLQGGAGLMTRTHASDKVEAYAESIKESWQEGLSYNFVNIHLMLSPEINTAIVPYNTPLFTVYPVLIRQNFKFEDIRKINL